MSALRTAVVAVALAAALALPGIAAAAECPQTSLADIEDEVMCPICGTPLELATEAPQAQRERAYIDRLIAACKSKDEIKRALVAQFGDEVLALPGDEGDDDAADVLVYAIPAVAIILALVGIALAVARWRGRPPARLKAAGPARDGGRLESDMERYDL